LYVFLNNKKVNDISVQIINESSELPLEKFILTIIRNDHSHLFLQPREEFLVAHLSRSHGLTESNDNL